MMTITEFSKKHLSSECLLSQVMGALTKPGWRWLTLLFLVGVVFMSVSFISPHQLDFCHSQWYLLVLLSVFALLAFCVCNTLTNIFSLRKNETGITWCQLTILFVIGLWIVSFMLILKLQNQKDNLILFGIAGSILTWIFQDKIKGAAAFIHLRLHHLLCIGDWIKVPQYNVDGMVQRISLTTVVVYNWDTTRSTIPISVLQTDHFINLQNMMEGKTYGRRMFASFLFDTGWFHPILPKEAQWMIDVKEMKEDVNETPEVKEARAYLRYLSRDEIKEGMLNAQLFRLYVYHWLMNHSHISQQPRLIVRWLEQKNEGMPLQVYAYIIDSGLVAFEWQQSEIMEHIIKASEWFGMRLYQSPSAYDVSNNNVYLAPKPANYRREVNNE